MMYINSFITELLKKVETVELQLSEFEKKMKVINDIKNMIVLKTLKDIEEITGDDLILLSKEEFAQVLEEFKFDNQSDKLKIFFNASVAIKVNQKLLSDGEVEIQNTEQVSSYKKWLNEQAKFIKEYLNDFNENNKEYYNSLKVSDTLYKKYLSYFKNEKLIKPIYNIEEFNEVIKKSGIITSDKWQLMKYVGEKNIEFHKNSEADKKEKIEYTDEEILSFVEEILKREQKLLEGINDDLINESLQIMELDEQEILSKEFNEKDIVNYQKIPILDAMNKIYSKTKELLKDEHDEDASLIEKNFRQMLELVQSYDVIKKIEC